MLPLTYLAISDPHRLLGATTGVDDRWRFRPGLVAPVTDRARFAWDTQTLLRWSAGCELLASSSSNGCPRPSQQTWFPWFSIYIRGMSAFSSVVHFGVETSSSTCVKLAMPESCPVRTSSMQLVTVHTGDSHACSAGMCHSQNCLNPMVSRLPSAKSNCNVRGKSGLLWLEKRTFRNGDSKVFPWSNGIAEQEYAMTREILSIDGRPDAAVPFHAREHELHKFV